MNDLKTYTGSWWIPSEVEGAESSRFVGTLTIDDDNSCLLSLHAEPTRTCSFENIAVFWGKDNRGVKYSLFGLAMKQWVVGKCIDYKIRYVISGVHIKSLDEPYFDECHAEFPYLQNWTEASMMAIPKDYNDCKFTIQYGKDCVYVQGDLEDGLRYRIVDRNVCHQTQKEFMAWKESQYQIVSDKPLSIRAFNNLIREFAQFLSLALYSKQNPSTIYYRIRKKEVAYKLIFVASPSKKPFDTALISMWTLKDRIPNYIEKYHTVYDKIETLTRYLLTSIHTSDFDAPIFIVVAQALEGYYHRFLKGTDGVSSRKWEALIDRYNNIKAVKDCNINADVLKATRDRYSHLYIEENPEETNVAEGADLIILTHKCKILLTCCILEQIGMTTDEINKSINRSVLQYMAYNVKKYEEQQKQRVVEQ